MYDWVVAWETCPVCLVVGLGAWARMCETIADVNQGVRQVTLDEEVLPGNEIPLLDDGRQQQMQILVG